jgi:hypothetical protein
MKDLSSESQMETALRSRRRRLRLGLGAALATMALTAPAATAQSTGDVTLHRDGSKAVPFRAYSVASESSHGADLRRDGSKADPFVADLAPTAAPAADGFDWGDAAVGLGAGVIAGVLGFAAIGAYGGRRAQTA